jgi:hypothetical protein
MKTISHEPLSALSDADALTLLRRDAIPGWSYSAQFLSRHDPGTGNLAQVGKFSPVGALAYILADLAACCADEDEAIRLHLRAERLRGH